jgi:hypothetical protein
VAPDVDHGVACTWHWTSIKYPEPVGRMCWILSMNWVALSASGGAGDESIEVVRQG